MTHAGTDSLRSRLDHEPVPLKFGTSGRRGRVVDLTQLEIYINALAELEYLQSLPQTQGGIVPGDPFYFAFDLRLSSSQYVPEQQGRGEIAQAIERAIADSRLTPVNLGRIPTPALAYHALQRGKGAMMITGSHIPFELNGYKTYTAKGEIAKSDEEPIDRRVQSVRERLYQQTFGESLFNEQGRFKTGHHDLSVEVPDGEASYLRRYTDFYGGRSLTGKRYLVFQHSAVGRDLLVRQLKGFGAEVIAAGRSDTFVPIDTENVDAAQIERIQHLVDDAWKQHGPIDAVVSTDGDSDRPLVLALDAASGRLRFIPGDSLGMIVANLLNADAVVVPISCNDSVDRGPLKDIVEPKTRIGSPFVIAGIEAARARGRRRICGWEANGGFLVGSDIVREGKELKALVTRDPMLPILEVLFNAAEQNLSLGEAFDTLPKRFGCAGLLKNVPRERGAQVVRSFSPSRKEVQDIRFTEGGEPAVTAAETAEALELRSGLAQYFTAKLGFDAIVRLNFIDGVRIFFKNGDIAHIRPSGNADELRLYAVADSESRADAIVSAGVAEPDGILRRLSD